VLDLSLCLTIFPTVHSHLPESRNVKLGILIYMDRYLNLNQNFIAAVEFILWIMMNIAFSALTQLLMQHIGHLPRENVPC